MRGTLVHAVAWLLLLAGPATADTSRWVRDHVHGFLSQGYLASTRNNYLNDSRGGDLRFAEAGLNATQTLGPDLSLGGQVLLRELGPLGNYEPELAWAFVDWHPRTEAGLRLGAFRLANGLYNDAADVDPARSPILLPQSIYNLQFRDFQRSSTGAATYGTVRLLRGDFSYECHFGWSFLEEDGSVARTLDDFGGGLWEVSGFDPVPGVGTALVSEWPGADLRAGLTYQRYLGGHYAFRVDPAAGLPGPERDAWTLDAFDIDVVSLEYTPSVWTFVAEYGQWNGTLENARLPIVVHDERYYVQAARALTRRLEATAYFSSYVPDRGDRDGGRTDPSHRGYQRDAALSLCCKLSEHWIAKVAVHDVWGTASLEAMSNPDGMSARWRYLATKLSVMF